MRPVHEYLDGVAKRHGEALRGSADARVTIRLALDFRTWERLDSEDHSPADAGALMARLAVCAARR